MKKLLGFRSVFDVIGLDPSVVKGSHGRRTTDPAAPPGARPKALKGAGLGLAHCGKERRESDDGEADQKPGTQPHPSLADAESRNERPTVPDRRENVEVLDCAGGRRPR